MAVLADYRTDVANLLASGVDASTWTTALLDESLRLALFDLDALLVYETSFTVVTTGYEHDLSTIPALRAVLAVTYPWTDDSEWADLYYRMHQRVRFIAPATVRFESVEPVAGEVIRVRYSLHHKIENLDGAAATTVSPIHRPLVALLGAGAACELRYRQVTENPAIPLEAGRRLWQMAGRYRERAGEVMSRLAPIGRLRWGSVGLE